MERRSFIRDSLLTLASMPLARYLSKDQTLTLYHERFTFIFKPSNVDWFDHAPKKELTDYALFIPQGFTI